MEPYAKQVLNLGVDDVAAYFASRRREPTPIPSPADAVARGRSAAAQCAICHGPQGQGDAAKLIPSLAGQAPGYLREQMLLFKQDRRSPGDPALTALKALMKTHPGRDFRGPGRVLLEPPLGDRSGAPAKPALERGQSRYHGALHEPPCAWGRRRRDADAGDRALRPRLLRRLRLRPRRGGRRHRDDPAALLRAAAAGRGRAADQGGGRPQHDPGARRPRWWARGATGGTRWCITAWR